MLSPNGAKCKLQLYVSVCECVSVCLCECASVLERISLKTCTFSASFIKTPHPTLRWGMQRQHSAVPYLVRVPGSGLSVARAIAVANGPGLLCRVAWKKRRQIVWIEIWKMFAQRFAAIVKWTNKFHFISASWRYSEASVDAWAPAPACRAKGELNWDEGLNDKWGDWQKLSINLLMARVRQVGK